MHWHAIRKSTGARGSTTPTDGEEPSNELDGMPHFSRDEAYDDRGLAAILGEDNTCDPKSVFERSPPSEAAGPPSDSDRDEDKLDTSFFPMSIPTSTSSTTTFAHERALRNRIRDFQILKGGEYDMRAYTCLLYTSPSPRDGLLTRMPSSA